jgi:hypothetical protein
MILIMKRRCDRGGVGGFLLLILAGYVLWIAYGVGRFYFDKTSIENQVAEVADDALLTKRGGVRERVGGILDGYNAHYQHDKIIVDINSAGDRMAVTADYNRMLSLIITDVPMNFHLYVQREQGRGVGIVNQVQESVEGSYNNSAQRYQKSLQGAGAAPSGE